MIFGLTLIFWSAIIGITVGATQGYFGGLVDLVGQRIVEIWAGLPVLFVIIILTSLFEPNPVALLLVLLLFNWMAWLRSFAPNFFVLEISTTLMQQEHWARMI